MFFVVLTMAKEIGRSGEIIIRQPDREFLLRIKNGEFSYEALLELANDKLNEIEKIYHTSDLPEKPDLHFINQLLVEMRKDFYLLGCSPST